MVESYLSHLQSEQCLEYSLSGLIESSCMADESCLLALTNCLQAATYTWIEGWSEEWSRPYFFNQETHESIWDRPADMAWQRAPAKDEL